MKFCDFVTSKITPKKCSQKTKIKKNCQIIKGLIEQFSISLFYQKCATVQTSLMGFTCLLLIPGSEIAPLCEELLSYMSAKVCLKNYWENEENL